MSLSFALPGLLFLAAGLACLAAPSSSSAPPPWENEIREFEKADRLNPPPKDAVLFIGSSSIRMWESLAEDFPGVETINRGFGGSQIADSVRFADRIAIPYRPRMIVMYAGDNDIADGKTPQQVFEDYKRFVQVIRQSLSETKIAYISIKPSPSRWSLVRRIQDANALIRRYAAKEDGLIFIDVFPKMLGEDGKPRPELYVEDKLHLSRKGYEIWKEAVAPYLK